jgi:hypothetical protein
MQYYPYASSLCHDRYAECFEAYKRISTEWECMRQWIHDNLLDSLTHQENISILSLGSGEKLRIDTRFDLIHFTHCLYYIPDRAGAVLKALNMIVDHGMVLIFHQTPMGINQIQRKFLKRVKGTEKEMFSSKELQAILHRYHIKYHFNILDSFMDVSDCLMADSETRQKLISFFLESDTRQLLPEIGQEICRFIKELSWSDQGHNLIFQPVAVFSLFKSL